MVSIVIVGAAEMFRGAVAAVLGAAGAGAAPDLVTVADVAPRGEVVGLVRRHYPDVVIVLLDRHWAESLDLIPQLLHELPGCRVLLVAGRHRASELRPVLARVWGLVGIDISPHRLGQAARQVAAGERAFDPELAMAALRPSGPLLTTQERAVLSLAAAGLRSREIAGRLFLSPGTVRNYLSSAKRKTGARNRLEAVHLARENGWLRPDGPG